MNKETQIVRNIADAAKRFVHLNTTNRTQRSTLCAVLKSFSLTLEDKKHKDIVTEAIMEINKDDI